MRHMNTRITHELEFTAEELFDLRREISGLFDDLRDKTIYSKEDFPELEKLHELLFNVVGD